MFDKMSVALIILLVVNILAALAISVVLTFMELCSILGYDIPCIKGEGAEEIQRIKKIKKYISYSFKFL